MVNVTASPEGNILTTFEGTEYVYNLGDMSFMLVASVLVFIMTPGVAFLYAGLLRKRSALSMLWLGMAVYAVVFFEWVFWGATLTFSRGGTPFIGNLDNFFLMGMDIQPSTGSSYIPQLLYVFYQAQFACVTAMLAAGAFADRARLGPVLLFIFCWTTIVYNPIAHWSWSLAPDATGWMATLGALDFAGGSPVHISSGTAALAISLFLGRRRGYGTDALAYRPANVGYIVLGTALIWFAWFGFNAGSALGANLRSVQVAVVTFLAASAGGITWLLIDYRLEKKWSAVGVCSGVIAGLVAITPAAGYVGSPAALAFGVVGAIACNFATGIKTLVGIDDTLDVFALHGIGGLTGNILTAFFADSRVASFDGSAPINGGWINHNWIQLGYQLADSCSAIGWSFVLTMVLLFLIDRIPGCAFRASEEDEIVGIDLSQIGEECYIIPNAPVYRDVESGGLVAGHEGKSQHSTGSQEKIGEATQHVV